MSTGATLPPGPRLPSALATLLWFTRPGPLLERARARYGDAFTLRIAHEPPWVVISDPGAVRDVFTGDPRALHAGEAARILRPVLGERSVLVLDDSAHLEQRKLMLPPFHGERLRGYRERIATIAREEIASWPRGRPLRLWPRMQAITLRVIVSTVFGVEGRERQERVIRLLGPFLDRISHPAGFVLPTVLGPYRVGRLRSFRSWIDPIRAVLMEEIAGRRADPRPAGRDSILDLLVEARHEDGRPISDEQLRDELMTLLVAGHETTATALAWAIERLVRHPDKLDRLTAEAVAGEDAYVDAVVKETLRLRPVIPIVGRVLKEPMEIGGRQLPSGTLVAPCIYLVHRRPDVYPEPSRFLPERFLDRKPGTYTWIPFGGGVRRCLGASFAELEMATVLGELVGSTRLRPSRQRSERVRRRSITLTPSQGAEVVA